MSDEPGSPSETAFARDLVELDRELDGRIRQSNALELPADEHRRLIAGLLAGMTYVGRPPR